MKYDVNFDFTVVKKGSNFIGKSGVIEMDATKELDADTIEKFKTDKMFKATIANHLATTMKQKNIFMVNIKSIILQSHSPIK